MVYRLALAALLVSWPLAASAAKKAPRPVPIHPDTLPTLLRSWSLPASLAGEVANAYTPRIAHRGDTLFVYDHNGRRLAAVALEDGAVRWHQAVPTRSDLAFAVTPFVSRGQVFVASDGYIHAFEAKSGKPRWRVGTRGTAINGLARAGRHLFVPLIRTEKGRGKPGVQLWSIDLRRGRVEWTRKLAGALAYVRANASGAVFINDAGLVLGLTADRGEPRWKLQVKGQVNGAPVLSHGTLYLTTLRRKTGWTGSGVYAVDATTGKLLWDTTLPSAKLSWMVYNDRFLAIDAAGKMQLFDSAGKVAQTVQLQLDDQPQSLRAASAGERIYVFSYHEDGHGYVHLVDMKAGRVIAKANALDQSVRGLISTKGAVVLDGADGTLYAYHLNRSERPRRRSVPPEEFAQELLTKAESSHMPLPGLAQKLAGLGEPALGPMAKALQSTNPHIIVAVAQAAGMIGSVKAAPALLKALGPQLAVAPGAQGTTTGAQGTTTGAQGTTTGAQGTTTGAQGTTTGAQGTTTAQGTPAVDAAQALLDALRTLRDARAVPLLKRTLEDPRQPHQRRRTAYVALGALGTPKALAPLLAYRKAHALGRRPFRPQAQTETAAYRVEDDPAEDAPSASKLREAHSKTLELKDGRRFTLALSPYLGGYNDLWIQETRPHSAPGAVLFTGLTKAEIQPHQYVELLRFSVEERTRKRPATAGAKGANTVDDEPLPAESETERLRRHKATLQIKMKRGKSWVAARAVTLNLGQLAADSDGDGLPDVVERRLQLCVHHADCDGDGIKDSEDLNPLASAKHPVSEAQQLYREAFFTFFSFLKRRGIVVVDPGDGPSFELYGRQDPVLSLRRNTLARLRKKVGLHAIDVVSFGGPYPPGGGAGDALRQIAYADKGRSATIGMDIVRSGDNAVAYNVTLRKSAKSWVVTRFERVWTTDSR